MQGIKQLDEILKLKNKLKRNEDYIDDKCKVSEEMRNKIRELEETYNKNMANEMYISLPNIKKVLGEESVEKLKHAFVHTAKIKSFDWMKSNIEAWVCMNENHINVCADCTSCDRKLDKCIGEKTNVVLIK